MAAYYNEIDKYCARWLLTLMRDGLIPDGDVDERSITQVSPYDLKTYTQCHFFAGIAGWSRALRLAHWPDDRPVWTGSCPCQPFSAAGRQQGQADQRHLWPAWFRLIRECRPPVVFGEQVAAAIAFGWLDEVFHDLEAESYACAAAVLPACSVRAPHKRERLWFVADTAGQQVGSSGQSRQCFHVADASRQRGDRCRACAEGDRGGKPENAGQRISPVGHSDKPRSQGRQLYAQYSGERSPWTAGVEWIAGADGKARPVKPGICLLANGVPARVGALKAYGNAIVPQLAAEFISAYEESRK